MNRTALVLSLVLLLTGFALAQQNPPIAQPQPNAPATPGVAEPVAPAVRVTQDRAMIAQLVQQLNQAAMSNDVSTLDRVLASNYQAINAQGVKEDKNDILKAHRNRDIKFESVEDHDQDIQVAGDTATERSTSDIKGVYKGQRFDGTYSSTRSLQRQPDGTWQIVSFEVHKVK